MSKRAFSEMVDKPIYDNNDTHLWMAVLDRAVRDLIALERYKQDVAILEDPVFRYDYRTLRKWFSSKSMEPGAFNWICSLVGIDPKWALKRIQKQIVFNFQVQTKKFQVQTKKTRSVDMRVMSTAA